MAYVLNAYGVPLYYSASSVKWFSPTTSGLLYGSIYNDSLYGNSSLTVTMFGGKGDDFYYLYSGSNKAVEFAGFCGLWTNSLPSINSTFCPWKKPSSPMR